MFFENLFKLREQVILEESWCSPLVQGRNYKSTYQKNIKA